MVKIIEAYTLKPDGVRIDALPEHLSSVCQTRTDGGEANHLVRSISPRPWPFRK